MNNVTISNQENVIVSGTIPLAQEVNIQAGFSPFKFVSLSGSFFNQNTLDKNVDPSIRSRIEYKNTSISGSIGGYYFYKFGRKKHKSKKRKSRSVQLKEFIRNPAGLIFDLKAGISNNSITNLKKGIRINRSTLQLKYLSKYIQLGIFYSHRFGQIGMTNKFINTDYNKIKIDGSGFRPPSIYRIVEEVDIKANNYIYEMNISNQLGTRQVKFIMGLTINNSMFERKRNRYIEEIYYYSGISFDINGLRKIISKKY